MSQLALTACVKAGGCASKLSPKLLAQVLRGVPRAGDENVLVGYDTSDDAGVYRLSESLALVQTVDFFTPIVDDPFTYGAIAATNALSDVYAMGGVPLTALAMVCYPGTGDLDVLGEILRGGADTMRRADCSIVGGHSVNDDEIKFGYSITGRIHPDRVWKNAGARPGDALVFTKKLGTGLISTALKRGFAREADVTASIASMLTLNRDAARALDGCEVHACTDVTGFSFLGHGSEMANGSGVTLEIDVDRLRFLPGALDYARQGALSSGLKNNREFASGFVDAPPSLPADVLDALYDPQTSGGLLVSLPETEAGRFLGRFDPAYRVGRVLDRQAKSILLR